MPHVIVTLRTGEERQLNASKGVTVMEVIRDAGIGELLALCGGACSCATCHVYVDPAFASRLSPPSPDEQDILDGSEHRTEQSRLSCQIPMSENLDGIKLTIAPED
jgi:2Fe-2S ferredoxin